VPAAARAGRQDGGHRGDAPGVEAQPVQQGGGEAGLGPGLEIAGVGLEDLWCPGLEGVGDAQERRALDYMHVEAGKPVTGMAVDIVFLGSCTNSRISDLRAAAGLLRGRRINGRVRMLVVPGSIAVQREAEREGLDQVFRAAGAEWREPGCSMCIAMNGDLAQPGQLVVSTSNRNFEGRQGPGARTVLASPLVAAASALAGCIADPRDVTGPRGLALAGEEQAA